MGRVWTAAACGVAVLVAPAAGAQEHDFDMKEAQREIAELVATEYEGAETLPMTATAVVTMLEGLGYTAIQDFDVDRDEYEVEATAPGGEEVEIEIDPLTGEILEIEEE